MTKTILTILFLGIAFSKQAKLNIIVNDIQVGKGNIYIAIFDNEKNFFKNPIARKCIKADKESLEVPFDIPEGVYAIAVYQDINENRELDKGWFNIPKEPYGLSNNFRPSFSAPTFDDCKFKLLQEEQVIITLK